MNVQDAIFYFNIQNYDIINFILFVGNIAISGSLIDFNLNVVEQENLDLNHYYIIFT